MSLTPPTQLAHPFHQNPPQCLINLDAARERFGSAQVAMLMDLIMTGDSLADAVIAEITTIGTPATTALIAWRTTGVQPDPGALPALHALFTNLVPPPTLDWERIERGATAYRAAGALWTMLALGPGSLVHTYLAPVPASILVRTGNLMATARQRLIDTGAWLIEVLLPHGLRPGHAGVHHTLEVRLLHSRVRATLLARGWDRNAHGLPLNQLEMTRTWLDFTLIPFTALARLGLGFTAAELRDLYVFWQWLGHLMGVDPRLIALVHDQASAREVLDLIDSTMPPPSHDSRALTAAMIDAIASLAAPSLGRLAPHALGLSVALARRIHGRRIATQLDIPRTWVSLILPFLVANHRLRRWWNRRSIAAWAQACARGTRSFETAVTRVLAQTVYQQAIHGLQHAELPRVSESATS